MTNAERLALLAVVHPPERSGLHTFWEARWTALRAAGVDVHLVVPDDAVIGEIAGVPPEYLHRLAFSRPRGARHPIENLHHALRLRREADELAGLATTLGARVVVSHGPHFLTAAMAARRHPALAHCLLIHSDAAPTIAARLLRAVRPPDLIGYELPSTLHKYAKVGGHARTFMLRPVLAADHSSRPDRRTDRGERLRVGFVAAMSPRKRVDLFAGVAEVLESRRPGRFEFPVIGVVSSSQRPWFESTVRPSIERLSQAGVQIQYVDGSGGARGLMSDLDCLVMTSDSEGVPNVVMEALAEGATVVSRRLEGVELIADLLQTVDAQSLLRMPPAGNDDAGALADLLDAAAPDGRHELGPVVADLFGPAQAASDFTHELELIVTTRRTRGG